MKIVKEFFSARNVSALDITEYCDCIRDLFDHPAVQSMKNYTQHRGIDILEHALSVSYMSFKICRERGYDYRSAARGALLHDFFLYQRRVNKPYRGWHTTGHPRLALKNAVEMFELNEVEKDIIEKHMWPICVKLPRFKETYAVSMADKYCCATEFLGFISMNRNVLIKEQFAAATS